MANKLYALALGAALAAMGCIGQSAALETANLVVNGQPRTFLIERPNSHGPQPTVILLHGLGGSGEAAAHGVGLAQLAQRQNFVAVFPDGIGHAWNHFPPGTAPARYVERVHSHGMTLPDDVAFLKVLVNELVARGVSDPTRIYLAGISAGGFMTLRMACIAPDMFAAVGTIISGMPEPVGNECHPAKPMPIVMIKGTADPNVPYDGGLVKVRTFTVWPTEQLLAFFRRTNGCAGPSEQSVLPNRVPYTVEFERWTKCSGAPVEFFRVIGGVHKIPPVPNTAIALWAFFRDQSRAAVGAKSLSSSTATRTPPL